MGIRLSLEFGSDVKSEMALGFGRSDKKSKNESSQNDELYSGKCSHTSCEYFGATTSLQNRHITPKIKHLESVLYLFYMCFVFYL